MAFSVFREIIPEERLHLQAPLRNYTTMRVGGPADCLIEAASEEEIAAVLALSKANGMPVCVIGNGSNLLFSDEGYPGVVLHIGKAFSRIDCRDDVIAAQAGALLSTLSRTALEHSLAGLEFASGIPGSMGGAVCMNAGAYGGDIAQVLKSARVLIDGHAETWSAEQMQFSYRHSAVMDSDCVVLSAEFQLHPGNTDAIQLTMNDLNARRREKQPLQYPSCGSFFKRPEGHYAGKLIEEAGLKGFSIGDAQVSALHAGFVINRGHATAKDVFVLMRHVQKTVYDRTGVRLEPEVRLIGHFDL